jgi:cytochrome c oxidase subunit 2
VGVRLLERSAVTNQRKRRIGLIALLGLGMIFLGGCADNNRFERLGMPKPITLEGHKTLALWQGAWIAALVTGGFVWGLIFYAVIRFRRRSDDEIPIQTRYNLPLEIFYTIFPVIMVIVFFSHTVKTENAVLHDDTPDNIVQVVGQQWSWTFNYPEQGPVGANGVKQNVYEAGTGDNIPNLYIPVDETTEFLLHSPDVIHDFGVPGFLIKMDVVPGLDNHFEVTPTTIGVYDGKCYELCGVYHSRMLFHVHVVSEADYQAYLVSEAAAGFVSEKPLCGSVDEDLEAGEPADSSDNEQEGEYCA